MRSAARDRSKKVALPRRVNDGIPHGVLIGLDRVGSGRVGSGWVKLGRTGLGWVGLGLNSTTLVGLGSRGRQQAVQQGVDANDELHVLIQVQAGMGVLRTHSCYLLYR